MFNKAKDRRIAELEAQLRENAETNYKASAALRNQVEYLVRTLRNMDEQIYKISQCTSFDQMRPNIKDLVEGMTVRKRAESDRISEILRPELIKTYNAQKRIGND